MYIYCLLLLFSLTAYGFCNAGESAAQLIQVWRLDAGSRLLPLTKVKAECNNGPLLSLRIHTDLLNNANPVNDDMYYIVHAGQCKERRTREFLVQLEETVKGCYRDGKCESIDLEQAFYSMLVGSGCSICSSESQCQIATAQLLAEVVSFKMETACDIVLQESQLLTSRRLNKQNAVVLQRDNFPTNECKGELQVHHLFLSNSLRNPLVPSEADKRYTDSLATNVSDCLSSPTCQHVSISVSGLTNSNTQVQSDYVFGLFWQCSKLAEEVNATGNPYMQDQGLKTALIVVSVLLALTLLALLAVVLYFVCIRENDRAINRLSGSLTRGRQPETLQKYQRPVLHQLEEHRYADLSLKSPAVEELYEYMDADTNLPTKPIKSDIDAEGYLIPQP